MDQIIAFPNNDNTTVEEHFGHCRQFALCKITDGKHVSTDHVDPPAHAPGVFPKFLGSLGVTAIITGGMGQMAVNMFKEQNISVILGATGTIEDNLNIFLSGDLASSGSVCENHKH